MSKHKPENSIDNLTQSIKQKKMNLENYHAETHNNLHTEQHKNITTETQNAPKYPNLKPAKPKKVKCTIYILESVLENFNTFYIQQLTKNHKLDKSDVITKALKNLMENYNGEDFESF